MQIPGIKTAKHFVRWVQARIFGGALILGYHRIASVTHDEYKVCVSPDHFAEQMEVLRKFTNPIPFSNLVTHLKAGSHPPKSVVVTFDDGYADNLYEAKPVLEKYEIPAMVFVCTGYTGQEFWWDELDRLVMSSRSELGAIRLEAGEKFFVWDQPEVSPGASLESRKKFRHALYHFLLELNVEEKNQAMDNIRAWSAVSSNEATARAMTQEELKKIAAGGLIEIGAHTRSHPMLPRLSVEEQREEIVSSKKDLEELLGKRVDGFAYPNGRATSDAKEIVRKTGFTFACTSLHDVVRPASDLHALTRFWQKDVDGEKFLRGLHLWMKDS